MSEMSEITIAQIWNNQHLRQPLTTTDGQVIRVVYPGVWTHGFGPDFRDAMLDFDGQLVTGDVEVELDVNGWFQHGHDRNPEFNRVILQVVAADRDSELVRRPDGRLVPRLVAPDYFDFPADLPEEAANTRALGSIGFEHCAPDVARADPEAIREIWIRAGDQRMQSKVASYSGELTVGAPVQVLYQGLMDALGFSRNREPMAEVAARLPISQIVNSICNLPTKDRFYRAAGLLLGMGGFLPLTPADSAIGKLDPLVTVRLEREWQSAGVAWHGITIAPGFWKFARLRPAAHPVRRLLAAAAIVSSSKNGLLETLIRSLQADRPRRSLEHWLVSENPYIGKGHGYEIIINVVIPFALAYSDLAGQPVIEERAAELWQTLPAGRGNAITKATQEQICGSDAVPPGSARAEQGLIHIHRNGCQKMRCYECPIAHLSLRHAAESVSDFQRL
jgi:hypothetical protein